MPAGYGWCFPARDELRIGVGSFDPRFHVKDTTVLLAEDLERPPVRYQGNWIPHKLRPGTEGGIFFVGDSAGHCLPLTAEGIRTALYFGIELGDELRGVVEGGQDREAALRSYAEFNDSPRVEVPLDAARPAAAPQRPAARAARGDPRLRAQALRRLVLRPLPADRAAGVRQGHQPLASEGSGEAGAPSAGQSPWRAPLRPALAGRRSANDQESARQQQADAGDPAGAERDLLEAEEPDPVEDHRGGELAGDRRRRDRAGADLADQDQRVGDVGGAERAAEQVVPADVCDGRAGRRPCR